MNRIYQGRVTKVEILNGKKGEPQPLENWPEKLWQHHELFQDAVNYYLVALVSLGESADSALTKLRERIAGVWQTVEKQGERRDGMGIGLAKRFALAPATGFLSRTIEIAQDGPLPDAAAAEKVGELILGKATGPAGIREAGRSLWPQLCNPDFTRRGNLAGGAAERLKAYGNFILRTRLHEMTTPENLREFSKECHLGWVVKTNPREATHPDSKKRLHKSVNHFLKVFDESLRPTSDSKVAKKTAEWLRNRQDAETELRILREAVEKEETLKPIVKSNRGNADRTEAMLLFQFRQCDFTAALLKQLFPYDRDVEAPPDDSAGDVASGSNFAHARGKRGYVLRAFTSFPFFGGTSATDVKKHGWPEFDIAAFKEALTVANQFNRNLKERKKKLGELANRLLFMAGEQVIHEYSGDSDLDRKVRALLQEVWRASKGKPTLAPTNGDEGNQATVFPTFIGDPRIVRLREIVTKDLADEYRLTEGRETPYGLRRRTMKGWGDVKRKWQEKVKKGGSFTEKKKEQLQTALNDLRTSKPEQIGSHRLFEALISSEESWRIWQEPKDEDAEAVVKNGWAADPLDAFRIYCETREMVEDLSRRELNFTPADAKYSRRLFSFTDACSSFGKPTGEFKHDPQALAVTVPLAVKNAEGCFQRTTVRATYSAPRLLRDQIRSSDGRYIQRWVQPLVAALCEKPETLPSQKELQAAAVELMPDWDKDDKRRFLLNFSLDFDATAISALVQRGLSWQQQFVAWKQGEVLTFLRWPRELHDFLNAGLTGLKKHCHWASNSSALDDAIVRFACLTEDQEKEELLLAILSATKLDAEKDKDKKLRKTLAYGLALLKAAWWRHESLKSFRVLSADLGTRHAASVALVEAAASEPIKPTTARFVGEVGDRKWFARYRAAKILRLPGENVEVYRHQTKQDVERGETPLDHKNDKAFREELHGDRGRLADDAETRQYRDILVELGQGDLLPEDCRSDNALSELRARFSFPEQNDKLLVGLRFTQRQLADLISEHWRLAKPEKAEQTETALEELREQKRYPDAAQMATDPARRGELIQFLHDRITKLRSFVQHHLLTLTERILPLRERTWEFVLHPQAEHFPNCHLLRPTQRGTGPKAKKLPGQRGLSMARIEQLSELRRRWQSLNQSLRREIGERPLTAAEMRARPIPDPCPGILRKLDEIRDQRVNQTAHLILAEALGVQLREPQKSAAAREFTDTHGEYKSIRPPVDFIVLENLDRYKANQGRPKSENSRLMQWCHRAVVDKIKELAEPFGVPVLETPAAYSSRFCSLTGIAGFRAVEVGLADRDGYRWRKLLLEAKEKGEAASDDAKATAKLFEMLERANQKRNGKQVRTLLAPHASGPIFITAQVVLHPSPHEKRRKKFADGKSNLDIPPTQADVNAAINLALRGIAHPACADIHHRVRTERKASDESNNNAPKESFLTRETRRFGREQRLIHVRPGDSLPKERNPNLFYDPFEVAKFDRVRLDADSGDAFTYSSGRGLWKQVNDSAFQWARCLEVNAARVKNWSFAGKQPA